MNRNTLKWAYKQLRGLFTNKTSHHRDRDGFLAFYNAENLATFERRRRGGTSVVSNYLAYALLDASLKPVMGMDFNFYDDLNATNKRYFMMGSQGLDATDAHRVHYWSNSGGTVTGDYIRKISSHTGAVVSYGHKTTMVPFKDRLFICSGGVSSYSAARIGVTKDTKTVTLTAGAWPTTLRKNDRIVIAGQEHVVASISGADLLLKANFTGTTLVNSSAYKVWPKNLDNFCVFDPNDTRQSDLHDRIQTVGTIPPPSQLTYTTSVYYYADQTDGWVYTGSPDNDTAFSINSSNPYLLTISAPDGATTNFSSKVAAGDMVYINDVEYAIERVSTAGLPATMTITLAEAYTGEPIDAVNCNPGANACTLNGIDGRPIPIEIWYGDIGTGDRDRYTYNYSYAYYDSHSGHVSSSAPQASILQAKRPFNIKILTANISGADSLHYDTLIFLRTQADGLAYYESGRIGLDATPNLVDHLTDDELAPAGALIFPTFGNDPPPEMVAIESWDGRLWGIQGDKQTDLRFSCAEGEVTAGRCEECWPPENYIPIPSEDGKIQSIKRAGDNLFIATDRNIYIVTAYYTGGLPAYNFQKVFGGEGVMNQSMCEYFGPLTSQPGLFFITNNRKAFIIAPNQAPISVGGPIEDQLYQSGADYFNVNPIKIPTLTDATLHYTSSKPRNYIVCSWYGTEHDALVYDVDMDCWYKHAWALGGTNTIHQWMAVTNIFGYPTPVGTGYGTIGASTGLWMLRYYNDECYRDGMLYTGGVWTSPTKPGPPAVPFYGTYTANIRTSWIDFDNRHMFKTLNQVRLFTNSSHAFLYDFHKDEEDLYIPASDVSVGADTITVPSGHGIQNGTRLKYNKGITAIQVGGVDLVENSLYYVVNTAATTIQLSLTSGGAALNFSDAGSGVHKLSVCIITNGTFATQVAPWQAGYSAGNRELIANIIDSGGSQRAGHCFSIDIKFPNAATNEVIQQLEFLGLVEGRESEET